MNISTDKSIIKNNFSKSAGYYDKYCMIQDACAAELIKRAKGRCPKNILDIGCGTGNYTKLLYDKFPQARIRAVDVSDKMIEVARRKFPDETIDFIVHDAQVMFLKEKFDLITSNAAFQWFSDFKSCLLRYKGMLSDNGMILFSCFGPITFYELARALKKLDSENSLLPPESFTKREELNKALKRFFKKVNIEEKIFEEKNESLVELLKKIKYTGTRGNGPKRGGFWTKGKMNRLEKIYKDDFNLKVTYQVFFCEGVK